MTTYRPRPRTAKTRRKREKIKKKTTRGGLLCPRFCMSFTFATHRLVDNFWNGMIEEVNKNGHNAGLDGCRSVIRVARGHVGQRPCSLKNDAGILHGGRQGVGLRMTRKAGAAEQQSMAGGVEHIPHGSKFAPGGAACQTGWGRKRRWGRTGRWGRWGHLLCHSSLQQKKNENPPPKKRTKSAILPLAQEHTATHASSGGLRSLDSSLRTLVTAWSTLAPSSLSSCK